MASLTPTPRHQTRNAKESAPVIRAVSPHETDQILALQALIHSQMPDPEIYADTDRGQFEESIALDYVQGAYHGDTLVAVAAVVCNRDTPRNLGQKCGMDPSLCFTFDAVFVHPDYRGVGIQSTFISMIKAEALRRGVTSVWATVSPKNIHSYRNLEKHGFSPYQKGVVMYGKHLRDILVCHL